jgi:hypothetical protein
MIVKNVFKKTDCTPNRSLLSEGGLNFQLLRRPLRIQAPNMCAGTGTNYIMVKSRDVPHHHDELSLKNGQ